jgi:hypothetical protein
MMIAVLMIALACGWLALWNARRLRRNALEAEANAQSQVTTAVFREVLAELGTTGRQSKEGGGFASSPGGVRWEKTLKAWDGIDIRQAPVIDVEALGGSDDTDLESVTIKDHGGPLGGRVIEVLTRAYRERGWRYVIMPRAGSGPGTGATGDP